MNNAIDKIKGFLKDNHVIFKDMYMATNNLVYFKVDEDSLDVMTTILIDINNGDEIIIDQYDLTFGLCNADTRKDFFYCKIKFKFSDKFKRRNKNQRKKLKKNEQNETSAS